MAALALANIPATEDHANFVRAIPSDPATLYDYFKANAGTNPTIYVSDTGKFVSMADVKPILSKRQGPENICFGSTNYWAEQIQTWWRPFVPASSCLSIAPGASGGKRRVQLAI